MRPRRPTTRQAMQKLIRQIRETLPFDQPEASLCRNDCSGCSMKLLAFLERELEDWEQRLAQGEKPGLAELSRLLRTARRVQEILRKNGLAGD